MGTGTGTGSLTTPIGLAGRKLWAGKLELAPLHHCASSISQTPISTTQRDKERSFNLKEASSTNISLELEEREGLRQGRVVIGDGAAEYWLRRRQRRQQGIEMGWG